MKLFRIAFALVASTLPLTAAAPQAVPTEGFFDSDGVRLRYVEQGSGTPVVLIHGFSVTPELNWGLPGVFDGLAASHRVIALDLRGHGRSGKPHQPAAYGIHFVSDVVHLLDHLKIPRAHVVGYSLGGRITLKLIAEHPDRVISGIVGGAGWSPDDRLPLAVERWAPGLERAVRGEATVADVILVPGAPAYTPEIRATLDANDPRALLAVLRSSGGLAVTERQLRANATPLLAVVGTADSLALGDVDRMVGVKPKLEVVKIPGADHVTALFAPLFGQSIARFLGSH